MLFDDNTLSIGGTPLVKLGRMAAGAKATVLAKIEGRNPGLFGQVPHRRIDDPRRAKRAACFAKGSRSWSRPAATPASRWHSCARRAATS